MGYKTIRIVLELDTNDESIVGGVRSEIARILSERIQSNPDSIVNFSVRTMVVGEEVAKEEAAESTGSS